MYQVSAFNSNVETVIHYPSANENEPHLNKIPIKEGLSSVDTISFSLYPNNNGYNKVFELSTKIKILDLRDNTIRFTGRILDVSEKMDSSGIIYKDIICEGALSYLNDTKVRNAITFINTNDFITQLLSQHNSKVESDKQIQVGDIHLIESGSAINGGFRSTLEVLKEFSDKFSGNFKIREVNNVRYLDWLVNFTDTVVDVVLGSNMKDMVKQKDITSLGTRIIPLGANNITIDDVNGGVDYIEDPTARSVYGLIEKTVEYKDITDTTILKDTCIADLSNHTQPIYTLESDALDLSYLTGNKSEQFTLGATIHLYNPIMGIDSIYKIVNLDMDLLTPYNPKLTISNSKTTLTNTINDLRKSSIRQDGVYNNVQVGPSFGIRAVKSDGKAVTTINATDGIRIQTNRGSGLVDSFYIDTNGNLKISTYDEITDDLSSDINSTNNKINDVDQQTKTLKSDLDMQAGKISLVVEETIPELQNNIKSTNDNINNVSSQTQSLKSSLDLEINKINAVVETPNGGASWELNNNAFIIAFNKAGSGNTEINSNGVTIYDGRFKIKKNGDTVFYVSSGGTCTADGGFRVVDGDTSCKIDSDGIRLVGSNGNEANIQILDDGTYSGTYIRDDLYVEDVLRVFGKIRADGGLSVNGQSLHSYIWDVIDEYCEDRGW